MEGDGQHKKLNKRQKKLVRRLMEMFKPHVEEEVHPCVRSFFHNKFAFKRVCIASMNYVLPKLLSMPTCVL